MVQRGQAISSRDGLLTYVLRWFDILFMFYVDIRTV